MTNQTLAAQWRHRFNEFARSGLSVERFCAAHNVSEYKFYYWRRKLSAAEASSQAGSGSNWLAVSVRPASSQHDAQTGLTVHVGSASIDVTAGFDPQLLRQIALALAPGQW
jgi:transposase-like protein